MPFVPTQKQVDSLYLLLTQFVRENNEIRIIRFTKWSPSIKHCEIEVLCLEDEDKYSIFFDGTIKPR